MRADGSSIWLYSRRKKEEGRRKKEEGRRKKEEGRRKKEEAVIAMVSAIKNVLTVGRGCYNLKLMFGLGRSILYLRF